MKRFYVAVLITAIVLAGCQAAPTPTPTPTETTVPTSVPTSAPTATPTPPPTFTPTPQPTATPETPTATPTPVPNDVWVDAVDGLNLRAEASATAKLVAILKFGQHLVMIGSTVGPDSGGINWQNVRTDEGLTGWVSAQFLAKTNPASATPTPTTAPAATPTISVTTGGSDAYVIAPEGLKLRAQSNTTSTVIAVLLFGQHVVALGSPTKPEAGGLTWQNVRADNGQTGWVSAEFLSTTKPVATTPTATPLITVTPAATPTVTAMVTTTHDAWVIAANGLNLRAQSNVISSVIAVLPFGQHVSAIGTPSAPDTSGLVWQSVRTDDGKTGWVVAEFLSTTRPATPTPTISPTMTPTRTAAP